MVSYESLTVLWIQDSTRSERFAAGSVTRKGPRLALGLFLSFCLAGTPALGQNGGPASCQQVPERPQRDGDPEAGYRALVSKGWVGCGIPSAYYNLALALLPKSLEPKIETLPGRRPGDEDLPYFLNRDTTKEGLEVLTPNCLLCHAGRLNGKLVVGLGNADGRYQPFGPEAERIARWIRWASWLDPFSAARRAEMYKVGHRMGAVAPYIQVPIEGSNPTHNLAWALVMHRNRDTLEWVDDPVLPLPPTDAPPSDVPPWWRMAKKHAMFAAAGGQGDHTGFMAVNSALCVDDVENFDALYAYFNDIHAYLASIEPPEYPFAKNDALAQAGRVIFDRRCAGCHGTYGETESYPNCLIPLEKIRTDPALAVYNVRTSEPATEWLNGSVFTRHGKYEPQLGYVAPPLDGIWATAPFLHNGSVPTLEAVLDSSQRPTYWRRSSQGGEDEYDRNAVGWRFESVDRSEVEDSDEQARRHIVDTTIKGFSNTGHTYGDKLTRENRQAVLEYLKTL